MTNLTLERPIAFFDLETTGLDISKERVIEICAIKLMPNGDRERFYSLVEPEGHPIGEGALEKHGIDAASLIGQPTFKEISADLIAFFEGCDLGGYNAKRFDVPLLVEEFLRAGINFDPRSRKMIDPYQILVKKEPRNLESIYYQFTGKNMENAHSAESDINATIDIFEAQMEKYDGMDSVDAIHTLTFGNEKVVDLARKFKSEENGTIVYNFGKHRGKSVQEVFRSDEGYLSWIYERSEMPRDTKFVAKQIHMKLKG